MVSADWAEMGSKVDIAMPRGLARATIVEKPFFDPKKTLAAA
jgi:aminomethyltransferase